ncbi:MAG: glycosyltransferase family 2 protein [Bacteroidota bacterium]
MKVSVILCTYNRAALLPRAISSVLRQTYADWELIIIDDGSTDSTRSVVRKFIKDEKRIRYFYQKNKGLAGARNEGMRKAMGDFLTFLDSDDAYHPEHLHRRVLFLQRHADVDFLHGGMRLVGPKKKHYVVDMTDPAKKIHLRRCHVGGTFFFRRKIRSRVRTFSAIPFGEDFDFYRRAEQHFVIRKVGFPTYIYHLDSENRLCDIFTEKLRR